MCTYQVYQLYTHQVLRMCIYQVYQLYAHQVLCQCTYQVYHLDTHQVSRAYDLQCGLCARTAVQAAA